MKRKVFCLKTAILVTVCLVFLAASEAKAEDSAVFDFGIGYRSDDLDWNIAGDLTGQHPNVLSELTWSDLKILQIKGTAKASVRRFYMRGSLGYGWILDGDNQDSDYLGDNRTLEFSRSNNDGGDGNVFDASIGIGYAVVDQKLMIAPLIGYSYHIQDLSAQKGFQTIETPPFTPPIGPFPGLDSTYEAHWHGPWIGVDVSHGASEKLNLHASFEYHWADYEAKANWNLRSDLAHPVSFRHDADGDGIVVSGGAVYDPERFWPLSLTVEYQDWSTDPGINRVFVADGTILETRLNEVNWESFAIMLGTAYKFY